MGNLKVLFLPSWYPTRHNPLHGIFIKKHAEAAANYCSVMVLYVTEKSEINKTYEFDFVNENDVHTLRVYYKRSVLKSPAAKLVNGTRYIAAGYKGLKAVQNKYGKPDLVHLNVAFPAGLLALLFKLTYKMDYVITEHWSIYTEQSGAYKNLSYFLKLLIRVVFRYAEGIHTVSNYLLRSLKGLGLSSEKTFVIPNSVDIQPCLHRTPHQHMVKLITVCLLKDEIKNITGLLLAFKQIADSYKNVQLDVVGDGQDRTHLENTAKELGLLNTKVFFHGYIPNDKLNKYFDHANFFVLNSNFETFSAVTIEAMAYGLPVVVTRCGGPEEFVSSDVGILVEKQSTESLVNGIEYMINNWHRYNSNVIKDYVRREFGSDVIGKRIYDMYQAVQEGNPGDD